MKNAIKLLLQNGATISCAYKPTPESWIGTAQIHTFDSSFVVDGGFEWLESNDIDKAVNYFCSKVFCKENLCYRKDKIHQDWGG